MLSLIIVDTMPRVMFNRVPRQTLWVETVLPKYDEDRFNKHMRMYKATFLKLASRLEGTWLFDGANQFSVHLQLAITLFSIGKVATLSEISVMFGIGDGSTIRRTMARVFKAVIALNLVSWPSAEEKIQMKEYASARFDIIDGSMTQLDTMPRKDGQFYSTYKKNCAVKWQVVCDLQKRVRHIFTGQYGAVHDSSMYRATQLYNLSSRYLTGDELMCGDSAYPLSRHCITPYKVSRE